MYLEKSLGSYSQPFWIAVADCLRESNSKMMHKYFFSAGI